MTVRHHAKLWPFSLNGQFIYFKTFFEGLQLKTALPNDAYHKSRIANPIQPANPINPGA
jgi:hypothetical protein